MTTLFHEWEARQRQDQFASDLKRRDSWNLPEGRLPRRSLFAWWKDLMSGPKASAPATPAVSAEPQPHVPDRKAG